MSATITQNNLKFVIFGSGHDYTRLDSGMGEKTFFSHPFVPLNSVNYAGQYYFLVPDQNGEFFDAVKEDLLHCTFDPDLGTAFDTEGEVTIKVSYRREYILPEETILVEKELEQTIEVVDHGTVASSSTNIDIYTDGYGFIRPQAEQVVEVKNYILSGNPTKLSSIPWRATGLGEGIYGFIGASNLTDIDELQYADTSNCTQFAKVFYNCTNLEDISALESWETSKVTFMSNLFFATKVKDLTPLKAWDVSKVTNLASAFYWMKELETLEGLEDWNVSAVTDMSNLFNSDSALEDISALSKWDVSSVTNMASIFGGCEALESLEGLEDWDVSSVTNLSNAFKSCNMDSLLPLGKWKPKPTTMEAIFFGCKKITTLLGLGNFDLSDCTNLKQAFQDCIKLIDIYGVETWDVSSVTNFGQMFAYSYWIADISAIADWEFGEANTSGMFLYVSAILDVDNITLDLSECTAVGQMFYTQPFGNISGIGDVFEQGSMYYDYDGNGYSTIAYTANLYTKDASNAENWTVNGTGLGIFDSNWSNRPSWN